MTPELSARLTSASAALSDYRTGTDDLDMTGRALWAERLASLLGLVLSELSEPGGAPEPAGRPRQGRKRPRSVVRVRLTGEELDAGFVARILRDHPELEFTDHPAHYSGGRVYLNLRVRRHVSEGEA